MTTVKNTSFVFMIKIFYALNSEACILKETLISTGTPYSQTTDVNKTCCGLVFRSTRCFNSTHSVHAFLYFTISCFARNGIIIIIIPSLFL